LFWALQKWYAGTLSLYLFLVPVFGIAIAVGIYDENIRFADVALSHWRPVAFHGALKYSS